MCEQDLGLAHEVNGLCLSHTSTDTSWFTYT